MPTNPRWLLAIPDALTQLAASDRPLLTRRDLEQLFGVSKPQAAILMRRFGAERTGNLGTLPREQLMRHLRALQQDATFAVEIDRRARFIASLHQARIASVRVPVKASVLQMRVSGLPEGVTLGPGRIEVRFDGAREAVQRLFALAQALTNDYATFETVVSDGERSR
nr:selenocysteine synthase N terminal [uncultured bacterium]